MVVGRARVARCSIRTSRSRRALTATLWLVLLAIGSQVIGWLLIGAALPKLPVVETSVLLLGQPVFTVIWGVLLFDERLSVAAVDRLGDRPRRRRGAVAAAAVTIRRNRRARKDAETR